MNEWEKLYQIVREKLQEAKAILEGDEPDLEQASTLREEAATIKTKADGLKAIAESLAELGEPQVPPLPIDKDNGLNDNPVEAAHVLRYGEVAPAVKAILVDLHGPEYSNLRWEQWKAFNRYIRDVDNQPTRDDQALMRTVVYTPTSIEEAMLKGVDVSTLKTTMIEAADVLGGYIVPVDFQNRVIERLRGATIMRGRASMITTSRDAVEVPKSTGGDTQYTSAVRVTWIEEEPTAGTAATNLTFGMERIPVNTVMAETFLSRNLIEDAAFDLAGYLTEKFAEAAAIDEDNRFLIGDGVGKPRGLLPGGTNPAGQEKTLSESNSLDANDLTWNGLIDLAYSIASQYRNNAVWIMERLSVRDIRKLVDGMGRYLWEPDQQAPMTPPRLMGFPVLEQEIMPTVAASAYPILFGDPRGYTIVDRVGMTIERYLDSATARTNTVVYIMRRRTGGQPTETYRWSVQKISA